MPQNNWIESFPGAITVCDTEGIILEMNDASAKVFKADGGLSLIGSNLLDCHPEPARTKLREMLTEQKSNIYMVEKDGKRKLIYQAPWYQEGEYAGFVEMNLPLPQDLQLIVRE